MAKRTKTRKPVTGDGKAVFQFGPETVTLKFTSLADLDNKLVRAVDKHLAHCPPDFLSLEFGQTEAADIVV